MFSRPLVNEFSWSKTRHGRFESCLRAYWYQYYGSWGGWDAAAEPEVRQAYILKNLATRQQWAGSVVHDTIKLALNMVRRGDSPSAEALVDRARRRMREEFASSRRGEYRERPKKAVGLFEHAFGEKVPDAEWKANWDNAERCLRNFLQSHWLEKARSLAPAQWLPVDEIDSFLLEGTKVFAGPDFAYRDGESTVLVDWKTGSAREEDQDQVRGYALFAAAKWSARPEQVAARLVYLSQGAEVEVRVDQLALEEFKALFRDSVARMKALLRDPAKNSAAKVDFPMTEETGRCARCAFQELCGRAAAAKSA